MSRGNIAVGDAGIIVRDVEIAKKDVADFFRAVPIEELESAFARTVEVGTFCLQRATAAQDFDFVRRQVESLVADVEKRISVIPADIERALVSKIGTADGQVLAPIQTLVSTTLRTTSDRLNDVRSLFNEIDPSRDGSATSKALKGLRDLLDGSRKDSVQGAIVTAVSSLTASDGALAKTVQATVESGLKPLREEIDRLAKEIRGQDAAVEALNQTTVKGYSFEEEIVVVVQSWAHAVGAQVEHVGADNRPGDVLISFPRFGGQPMMVVIEARDRQAPRGRKAIADTLEAAMQERKAKGAIYVSRGRQGLANEIGEWGEGECSSGSFVACTFEHMITALRFLIVHGELKQMRAAQCEIDATSILSQITRIRTTLDRVRTLNRKTNDIRGSASDIENEAGLLRAEIREALDAIEAQVKNAASTLAGVTPIGEVSIGTVASVS